MSTNGGETPYNFEIQIEYDSYFTHMYEKEVR